MHTQALEEHTRALNNLTAMLGGIFEERNFISGVTEVHPLHRTLAQFAEVIDQITSQNRQIASTIDDAADKMKHSASTQYDAANCTSFKIASFNNFEYPLFLYCFFRYIIIYLFLIYSSTNGILALSFSLLLSFRNS